jgi:hypothetical protein
MQRLSWSWLAGLSGLALLLAAVPAPAMRIMLPTYYKVVQAQAVVIGKVTAIEDKTVSATTFPGAKEKADYTVAVVKVEDALLGAKDLTHVKVGFVIPKPEPPPPPGAPIILRKPLPVVKLEVGQEVCLGLNKHHETEFFVIASSTEKKAPEVEQIKKYAKLLADGNANLKSKDAGERTATAVLLALRYRQRPLGNKVKEEEIDTDQSKLILKTLADADWNKKPATVNDVQPIIGFNALGVTDKDGWTFKFVPGQPADAYQQAAQTWLKSHADSYRIKKFVVEKEEEKKEK